MFLRGRQIRKGVYMGNAGRFAASASALCAAVLTMSSALAAEPAEMDFNIIAGSSFEGGQPVDMEGNFTTRTTQSETVRLVSQVRKDGEWLPYDVKRDRTNIRGEFSYRHEAFPAGRRYRTRVKWAETPDHLAGGTRWDVFAVERRTH